MLPSKLVDLCFCLDVGKIVGAKWDIFICNFEVCFHFEFSSLLKVDSFLTLVGKFGVGFYGI